MPQTRPDKIVVPVNADAYNFTTDLATMADSANVVVRVASQAERDALTKVNGLVVIRTDLPGAPIERCDGTAWFNTQHSEWTFSATGVPSATTWGASTMTNDATQTTDTGFVTTPGTDRLTIRDAGTYAVTLNGQWGVGPTGRAFSQFTGPDQVAFRVSAVAGENVTTISIANFRVPANTTITFTTYLTFASGTTTWQGRIRITRVGY